ncbi:unnamed protein product [Brassicogethes aeneus]|uniref:Uncharacterized protein n=1 Tax=Brassicogethes aeneus TaxID=1431903 RepID=A0A9P0B4I4_BRAAE|nr:unnamed protein product [Brassicogethes aeneus]
MARSKEEAKLRKKEYDKKRREEMKNNPEKLAEMREKEKLKYRKKREQGKLAAKLVDNMTSREHRQIKKEWRKRAQNYRKNKRDQKNLNQILIDNSPPHSPIPIQNAVVTPSNSNAPTPRNSTYRKNVGRKRVIKSRSKMYRTILDLKQKLAESKKSSEKYRKRYQRMKEKTLKKSRILSPNSKVNELLGNQKVTEPVRRKLLFGEVLQRQLQENYREAGSHSNKKIYNKTMKYNLLKKYRLINIAKKTKILNPQSLKNCNIKIRPRGNYLSLHVKKEIKEFFERDDVSRMTAGKKEYITFKKEQKQKRYLLETIKTLHNKFLGSVPYHVSYQSFCRLKPFWVLKPKVEDRETCRCIKHLNFEYIVSALYKAKVIETRSTTDVVNLLCCLPPKPECLFRNCIYCCNKKLKEKEFLDRTIIYNKWTTVSSKCTVKGQEKLIRKTTKSNIAITLVNLFHELQVTLIPFLTHIGNILHQYHAMSSLKTSLKSNEIIIHVDFSENFSCKYGEEVQSLHFGGSREQISLHTGVIYIQNNQEKVTPRSFCTISTSLRHDYVAIWAHLKIVFDWIDQNKIEDITAVHFLSDGPATQYRNRFMFRVISSFSNHFLPNIEILTWNYSEAGHGKGAADGVGGTLKRTADQAVAEGKDISNISQLIDILKERCPGIYIQELSANALQQVELLFSGISASTFSGTTNVHQVICRKEDDCIFFNKLSCFDCYLKSMPCIHFHLGRGYPKSHLRLNNNKALKLKPSGTKKTKNLKK